MKYRARPIQRKPLSAAPVLARQLQGRSFGEPQNAAQAQKIGTTGFELGNISILPPGNPNSVPAQAKPAASIQPKPQRQRQTNSSKETSTAFESTLNNARGNGQPLNAGLQRSMGQAMGADFSGVRIHADAQADQLSRSVSARAFTTGQDVFFRQGAYSPGSRSGQELIAHELTHVVQQKGQFMGDQQGSDIRLQRAATYYINESSTPVFAYSKHSGKVSQKRIDVLDLNDAVDGDHNTNYRISGSLPTYKKLNHVINGRPLNGVVSEDRLRDAPKNRGGHWDRVETAETLADAVATPSDRRAGSLDRGKLRETKGDYRVDKDGNTETAEWTEKHAFDVAAGGLETVGSLLSVASTLRKWKKRNTEERVSDVFDTAQAGLSTAASVTKIVDSGGKLSKDHRSGLGKEITVRGGSGYQTNQSDLAGKATGNIADIGGLLVDVKDCFFKGKDLWNAWKKNRKDGMASKGDVVRAAASLGITIVSAIKNVVSTARGLLFTLENAWHVGLSNALPAISIGINGLKLIVSIWDVVKAHKHRARMRALKREAKNKIKNAPNSQDVIEAAQDLNNYILGKELQSINRKRSARQIINLSAAIANITGDIMSLTGLGAIGGAVSKGIASGISLGFKGLRTIKQFGRDRAAKAHAFKMTKKIFDEDKSSNAKRERREIFANMIYDRIINFYTNSGIAADGGSLAGPLTQVQNQEFSRIKSYIRATGLSWKAWCNTTIADPDAGHKALMKALAKRE